MNDTFLLALYCLFIIAASLVGGYVPIKLKLTHTRMQVLMSAVAGFMFGVAVLHMLGHALVDAPVQPVLWWMMAGFLVMFFTERFFAFHVHDPAQAEAMIGEGKSAEHACEHHDHIHAAKVSWAGATCILTVKEMSELDFWIK